MDVAALCPLPVGIVAWQSPGRVLTVIVKATFSLGMNGTVTLAPVQEPLSLDRPSRLGADDELEYASDFAPLKARADVVMVGHAYAEAPTQAIRTRLVVDELDKSFFAVAAQPSSFIPLVEGYLRTRPAADAEPVRVGPVAPWAATRAPYADPAIISSEGPPARPLTSRFDFRFFNVAPPDQQLELLRATARLTLESLTPGTPKVSMTLPGIVPKVFYLAEGLQVATGRADPVALRCDTLWINTDRATCSLTWRGVLVEQERRANPPCLVVTMQTRGEEQPWRMLRGRLDAATHSRAVEASDLRTSQPAVVSAPAPPPPLSAKKFHDISPLRMRGADAKPDLPDPPPSQTRSMIFAQAPGRPDNSPLGERLRALREQKPPATPRVDVPNPTRPLLDDSTLDSPYANTADEPTTESPYRFITPVPQDEPTEAPDTLEAAKTPNAGGEQTKQPKPARPPLDFRPEMPPASERTVTTVHNPLLAAAAAAARRGDPPAPPADGADAPPAKENAAAAATGRDARAPETTEAPTRPKPPRVPFPILDEPTITMNEKIEVDSAPGEDAAAQREREREREREPRRG